MANSTWALKHLQPLPAADARAGYHLSTPLVGPAPLPADLDPPAMRQAIAWEFVLRGIREAEVGGKMVPVGWCGAGGSGAAGDGGVVVLCSGQPLHVCVTILVATEKLAIHVLAHHRVASCRGRASKQQEGKKQLWDAIPACQ